MGREKARKKGERREGRKRRHSRKEESESESSDEDVSSESSSESGEESETESSSTSEEERERRRRKRKKMKKRRSSEGSSSKHKSKSKKEPKKHKTHKKKKKIKNFEEISIEDYFKKSVELRTWLSDERKIFFSDLTSQQSHNLFKEFVKEWNEQALPKKYYNGLPSATLEHGKQTGHVWKFSRSLGKDELKGVRKSVSSWTAGDDAELGGAEGGASQIGPRLPSAPSTSSGVLRSPMIGPIIGPSLPGGSVAMETTPDPHVAEERWREEGERVKRGRREMRKQQELVMEELLPKATGKEARFEKKRMRAEKRRGREISPDVAESTLMGPKVDIHRKIQNRQTQRQNRAHAAADRVAEIQAKEKSRMQALMEMARANKKEGSLW
ncbi:Style cell-cycle inhibitor 1-B [Geodia barretti]|uniref:Style cell-cycle inhibitor 1-B n=1 Tax=Geodia barretti TaxID=519541 RepID=A0AA35SQ47_GEOBA|nr:Style cell-cycle inhibitor 1-B [Geodia barretti]